MIIGLTGTNGAGKTAAAALLRKKGFKFYSLSDVIREELAAKSVQPNRENLIAEGNRLRTEYGPSILAQRIMLKLQPIQNYVIDSIRNPHEVKAFRQGGGFYLLFLDAPRELRYERVCSRGGARLPASYDEFAEQEDRELSGNDSTQQQLAATWQEADETIENAGTIEEFQGAITGIAKQWMMQDQRPDWDTYFMQIARMVAMRSNCMKRKVAAVIVKDLRIVSTGYNGTPRGVKNCNEGGCPRCNSLADSGTRLDECLCSHAEENSIVQAAYHGISLKGSTIFVTCAPCLMCTKMIINAGIQGVVYALSYPLAVTEGNLFAEAGVTVTQLTLD